MEAIRRQLVLMEEHEGAMYKPVDNPDDPNAQVFFVSSTGELYSLGDRLRQAREDIKRIDAEWQEEVLYSSGVLVPNTLLDWATLINSMESAEQEVTLTAGNPEFSFLRHILGPIYNQNRDTTGNGISGGQIVEMPAGGICTFASALHKFIIEAQNAGIPVVVTNHHRHDLDSVQSWYANSGMLAGIPDTTVYLASKDYEFVFNNLQPGEQVQVKMTVELPTNHEPIYETVTGRNGGTYQSIVGIRVTDGYGNTLQEYRGTIPPAILNQGGLNVRFGFVKTSSPATPQPPDTQIAQADDTGGLIVASAEGSVDTEEDTSIEPGDTQVAQAPPPPPAYPSSPPPAPEEVEIADEEGVGENPKTPAGVSPVGMDLANVEGGHDAVGQVVNSPPAHEVQGNFFERKQAGTFKNYEMYTLLFHVETGGSYNPAVLSNPYFFSWFQFDYTLHGAHIMSQMLKAPEISQSSKNVLFGTMGNEEWWINNMGQYNGGAINASGGGAYSDALRKFLTQEDVQRFLISYHQNTYLVNIPGYYENVNSLTSRVDNPATKFAIENFFAMTANHLPAVVPSFASRAHQIIDQHGSGITPEQFLVNIGDSGYSRADDIQALIDSGACYQFAQRAQSNF